MYLVTRSLEANFLLNVSPTPEGVIPEMYVQSLLRLRHNLQKLEMEKPL